MQDLDRIRMREDWLRTIATMDLICELLHQRQTVLATAEVAVMVFQAQRQPNWRIGPRIHVTEILSRIYEWGRNDPVAWAKPLLSLLYRVMEWLQLKVQKYQRWVKACQSLATDLHKRGNLVSGSKNIWELRVLHSVLSKKSSFLIVFITANSSRHCTANYWPFFFSCMMYDGGRDNPFFSKTFLLFFSY